MDELQSQLGKVGGRDAWSSRVLAASHDFEIRLTPTISSYPDSIPIGQRWSRGCGCTLSSPKPIGVEELKGGHDNGQKCSGYPECGRWLSPASQFQHEAKQTEK